MNVNGPDAKDKFEANFIQNNVILQRGLQGSLSGAAYKPR